MFEVYATRWDSTGIVAELIPARGLSFSFPLSAHGEASFTATVEPGRSSWRASIGGPRTGVLIAESQENGPSLPLWAGRLKNESQNGPRSFQFTCAEWGSALSWFPAPVNRWNQWRDTDLYVDLLTRVQSVSGQNLNIGTAGVTPGAARSDFEVTAWDSITADEALQQISNAAGGPEWYYPVGGSLRTPLRQLVLGDVLGDQTPRVVLEYVEDTQDPSTVDRSPTVTLLSSLFPGSAPQTVTGLGRRGGNVLLPQREQDSDRAATVVVAVGSGVEAAQLRATATATDLLAAGFPRITRTVQFNDVTEMPTLQRHADAELASVRGALTDYSLVTLGSSPNWRQVSRGSAVRVELDTDVYAARRPLKMTSRVLNITVAVPDDGGLEQVRWDTGHVLEIS